jgi:hypothetical protein
MSGKKRWRNAGRQSETEFCGWFYVLEKIIVDDTRD